MPCTSSWMAALTTSSTRTIVAEVDDFGAAALQDAAHDVDGRIVSSNRLAAVTEADSAAGALGLRGGLLAQVGHVLSPSRRYGRAGTGVLLTER